MRRFLAGLLVASSVLCAPALAAPATDTLTQRVGTPLGTGAVMFTVTIVVKGVPVTKTVTIPKGAIVAFVQPARMKGEAFKDWVKRVAIARGKASQAKAKVYAEAINTAFGLTGADKVTVSKQAKTVDFYAVNNGMSFPAQASVDFGVFVIPTVKRGSSIKWTENKVIGEGGNGSERFPNSPSTPSPGSRGSLERATPGVATVATGLDPDGSPSVVDFGITGNYVADVFPTSGMTDATVLDDLALLLDAHGIPATFDASNTELFIDSPIPDGTELDWGNTDAGLVFTTVLAPVPEPDTWAMMLGGLGLLGATLRRRRRMRPA